MTKQKVDLFLDSGAYSAFSKGVEIDIQEYIVFIKEHLDFIEIYAGLDVIGDAEASLQNQEIMEEAGLTPIPCFHFGEDPDYLRYYVDRYDYIALGGVAQAKGNRDGLIKWLEECFDVICNQPSRLPKVKVHGFAVTSLTLMRRYPWYSVDSTSWVMNSRNGVVPVPKFRNGKYDYLIDPWKVSVSPRSPTVHEPWKHFTSFSPGQQEVILQYFTHKGYQLGQSEFRMEKKDYKLQENENWVGPPLTTGMRKVETVIIAGLSNNYFMRDELNIIYYQDLEPTFPEWPWPFGKIQRNFGLVGLRG
jgi:hypothetical protein